jgi:hypothetical protein
VLLEHSGQFLPKVVGHREPFLQARAWLGCRRRSEKAKRRQCDLVLALEVRVEHRRKFLRSSADSPGRPRGFHQRLVCFRMLCPQ